MAAAATGAPDAHELFSLLGSNEADVEKIKSLIHDNLNQTKESSYLNSLVDFYMNTGITRCQDILVGVREPHDKHLLEKLYDCLKGRSRPKALTLLGHVVHKQPSWLHKISQHRVLQSLLQILKTDVEASNLMSGILIIVSLLPIIPSSVGHFLNDIFDIFTRLAAWHTKKPASMPSVYVMHLHVAIYALFHRLYSMYPCNFLTYLRNYCSGNREHLHVFSETIRPMLECVRMHPMLVTFTKDTEISTSRWKAMETHDIVVECAKLSLDVIEGTKESQSASEKLQLEVQRLRSGSTRHGRDGTRLVVQSGDSIVGQGTSTDLVIPWSPGLCGLSTPPLSQQISPTSALADYTSPGLIHASSYHGIQVASQPEGSAVESGTDTAAVQGAQADKRSRSRAGTLSGSSTPYQSVPPSPLKMDTSPFRFSGTEIQRIQTGELMPPTPPKMTRVPLSRAAVPASVNLSKVVQKLEERQPPKFKYSEKEDITDFEVAAITEGASSSHYELAAHHWPSPITTGLSSYPRSGRGSGQWCKPLVLEYAETSQRARSYSQGKRLPRRATLAAEVGLRQPLIRRSHSLTDLSMASSFLEDDGTKLPTTRVKRGSGEAESRTEFPYEHLFEVALPGGGASAKGVGPTVTSPIFVQLSPPEILDRYLWLCGNSHSMQASGSSSKDVVALQSKDKQQEISILKGQIQLLHIQLLYERNKREIHAERNRRLLSKVKRVKTLEEQNSAMKDQMQLLENEVAKLTTSLIAVKREKLHLAEERDTEIRMMQEECASVLKAKVELINELENLKSRHLGVISKAEKLEKELSSARAEIFNAHHEMAAIQEQVSWNAHLRSEVERLSKELMLTVELNQKYQEKQALHQNQDYEAELFNLRESYSYEMNNLKAILEHRDSVLDSQKNRIAELESLLMKKDFLITEQKRLLKNVKTQYDQQVKAVEDKYHSARVICQHFEMDLLKMYQKLEEADAGSYFQKQRVYWKYAESEITTDMLLVSQRDSDTDSLTKTVNLGKGPLDLSIGLPAENVPTTSHAAEESPQPRRTSQPIDIEPRPSQGGGGGKARGRKSILPRKAGEDSIASDDESLGEEESDIESSRECSMEEKLSGALEPISSQSLASLVDIGEYE